MRARAAVTAILERAYAPEREELAWLEGIREAAARAFDGVVSVQASTLEVTGDGQARFGNVAGDEFNNATMAQWHAAADPSTVLRAWLSSGPVVSMSALLAQTRDEDARAVHRRKGAELGYSDVIGALGINPGGRICGLGFQTNTTERLSRQSRIALSRVAGHLAAAYRLRGRADDADAVLDPSGALLDARDDDVARSRARLREAAVAIDRARCKTASDPDRALGTWKAMVEGRWTLVERFDTDGRRLLLARENSPETRALHALTEVERKVVALVALSHPSKLVAYELGFSESAVSENLASALRKLGIRSRAELVAMHGALVPRE